jgi:uncharacterized protein (DUF2225 family)
MVQESSFLIHKVECPICKTVNEFEAVKVGAYTEGGRDTDFCPRDLKWRLPRYQGYNPLVFFAAVCGHCYYARELTNHYKEWKNDANFRTYRLKAIRERHLEKLSVADSVVRQMGEMINVSGHPNESAILKLHLAIHSELLSDVTSALDLGRFYLRIGWVYRYMGKTEDPNRATVAGLMDEIENKYAVLVNSTENVNADLEAFTRHLASHFESKLLSADLKSRMLAFRDRYDERVAAVDGALKTVSKELEDLKHLVVEYKGEIGGDAEIGEGERFGEYPSFGRFLLAVKRQWDGVALDEHEALKKAVQYYCDAFTSGRNISPGNQQIQVSYLIAELSRRIGDHDLANQYFNSTIKAGQEFIYQNRNDRSRTTLARKIMELAVEQGRANLAAAKPA